MFPTTLPLAVSPELSAVLQYSFYYVFFGMIAGALFFALERSHVAAGYHTNMTIATVLLAAAAFDYFYMREAYVGSLTAGAPRFPTVLRYLEWSVTVPLLVSQFPVLLGVGPRGRPFLATLVVLALAMIWLGYGAQAHEAQPTFFWLCYGASTAVYVGIVTLLLVALNDLPADVDPAKRGAIRGIAYFIPIGWSLYPLAFLLPALGVAAEWRELAYNFADLINKLGVSAIIYLAARKPETSLRHLSVTALGLTTPGNGERRPAGAPGGHSS